MRMSSVVEAVDMQDSFLTRQIRNPNRARRVPSFGVLPAGMMGSIRMGMEKTDDASLVFLRLITDLDPFVRIEPERSLRMGGDVAYEGEAVGSDRSARDVAEQNAAGFVRRPRPALGN